MQCNPEPHWKGAPAVLSPSADRPATFGSMESRAEEIRALVHDLANDLARVVGYLELISMEPHLPLPTVAALRESLEGSRRATETLTRLRQVTNLE